MFFFKRVEKTSNRFWYPDFGFWRKLCFIKQTFFISSNLTTPVDREILLGGYLHRLKQIKHDYRDEFLRKISVAMIESRPASKELRSLYPQYLKSLRKRNRLC